MNKNEITPIQIAIRIVIIIVVIVILLLVSFAMVRFVPKVVGALGNFRTIFATKERLEVSLDESIIAQDGKAILTITQSGGKLNGTYELTYSCAHIDLDTHLEIELVDRNDVVLCDEPFTIGSAATSTLSDIVIRPTGENVSYDQKVDITVKHIDSSSTRSMDSIILTVLGDNDTTQKTTQTTSTSTPSTVTSKPLTTTTRPSTVSNYSSSPAKLVATLKEVTVDQNARATVAFYVTNTGGKNSGAWTFNATLPRLGQTLFNSPTQSSIPPRGSSIMFLTFDNAQAGNVNINVQGSVLTVNLK